MTSRTRLRPGLALLTSALALAAPLTSKAQHIAKAGDPQVQIYRKDGDFTLDFKLGTARVEVDVDRRALWPRVIVTSGGKSSTNGEGSPVCQMHDGEASTTRLGSAKEHPLSLPLMTGMVDAARKLEANPSPETRKQAETALKTILDKSNWCEPTGPGV